MTHIHKPGTAIVTGASRGIGAVYADRLARRGYDLVLASRDTGRMEALAQRLRADTGRSVEMIGADLSRPEDVAALSDRLDRDASITLLVNNAGILLDGSLLDNGPAELAQLIAVNITAPTLLAAAAGRAFVRRGGGAIVNIASILAFHPELLDGVYSGSKAHLLNLTLSLADKLAGTGVRVQAVLPGPTRTDLWTHQGLDIDELVPGLVMDTADLVDAALVGFDRGELVTIPSLADAALYAAYEAARLALVPHLAASAPAERYREPIAA
jgi:hypothetical protein